MDEVIFRAAVLDDADGVSDLLQDLTTAGKRTRPSDVGFVSENYVANPNSVRCTLAVQGPRVLGFQSLTWAREGNPYDVTVGWGIIGTHIHPSAARMGIGRALFRESLIAARAAGVPAIDATIQATNAEGLAYYSAMGFADYRQGDGAVCKRFTVE